MCFPLIRGLTINEEGAEGETVRVYDVTGRMVQTFTYSSNQPVPAGVYMVKVGQHPARKVVVLR